MHRSQFAGVIRRNPVDHPLKGNREGVNYCRKGISCLHRVGPHEACRRSATPTKRWGNRFPCLRRIWNGFIAEFHEMTCAVRPRVEEGFSDLCSPEPREHPSQQENVPRT